MIDCKALEVSLDEDLRELSRYLWQQGFPHRITEQSGKQIVWVQQPAQIDPLRELYARWRRGEGLPHTQPAHSGQHLVMMPIRRFEPWRTPLTLLFVVLSVFGYLLVKINDQHLLPLLFYFEPKVNGDSLSYIFPAGQYWRLITPIFLHLNLVHIAFNMLWFWDLGGRVERVQGPWRLLGIVLLIGAGSNITQAIFAEVSIFGGMSGVIYGLLGYCWTWGWLRHDPALHVPTPVVTVMVVWLLLCMAGFTELLGAGSVANAAHAGGLILGLILGVGAALIAGKPDAAKS